jgi:hypothetical protein
VTDQKTIRTQVTKVLKARGVKPRKGQLRLQVGDLFWYVGLRSAGPAPTAPLTFEVGCWPPEVGPEPEGGALDCPLLLDVPLAGDAVEAAHAIADLMESVGTLSALAAALEDGRLAGALVDRPLRERLG